MVNIVDYAVVTLEGESQPIDRVLVNHGTYVGKLLKTEARDARQAEEQQAH